MDDCNDVISADIDSALTRNDGFDSYILEDAADHVWKFLFVINDSTSLVPFILFTIIIIFVIITTISIVITMMFVTIIVIAVVIFTTMIIVITNSNFIIFIFS